MSHLIVSLAWCCGQVFAVAAIATLLSTLVMRRSPGSAAAIALSGVLTAIGLTLIVPVRIPAPVTELLICLGYSTTKGITAVGKELA